MEGIYIYEVYGKKIWVKNNAENMTENINLKNVMSN